MGEILRKVLVGLVVILILSCSAFAVPEVKTYKAKLVGAFDDWESTIANKVEAVESLNGEFIYLWSDTLPEQIHLALWLGGPMIQSDTLYAPEYSDTRTVSIFSTTKPGGGSWTVSTADSVEGHVSDAHNNFEQSFKFFPIIVPFTETWDIVSVGITAVIQFGADLDQIQIRVLRIEKVVQYNVE